MIQDSSPFAHGGIRHDFRYTAGKVDLDKDINVLYEGLRQLISR